MERNGNTTKIWTKGWFKNLLFFLFICIAFFTGVPQWTHLKVRQALLAQPEIQVRETETISLYASDWGFIDTLGQRIPITNFRGKPMVISFWADWCMPCLAEIPSLEALRDSLANEEVEFAMVTGEPQVKIRKFLQKEPMTLPVYFMERGWPQILSHKGIPATFLIDKNGHVVFSRVGAADWSGKETVVRIRELFSLQHTAI